MEGSDLFEILSKHLAIGAGEKHVKLRQDC
jgi:hypothetical protein